MSKLPNINDLREVLWGNVQGIKKGTTTTEQANATTNAVGKYLSTVKLEMDYCKIVGKQPDLTIFGVTDEHSKVKSLGLKEA